MIRRLCACLLCLIFVFAALPAVRAESEESPGYDRAKAQELQMRFGLEAEVETDENGDPVSVNGYPVRTVQAAFSVRSTDQLYIAATDFAEYPFCQPATEYNGNLAVMSLMMALTAARDMPKDENPESFNPSKNVEEFLSEAGFSDIRKDDYTKETSLYTIASAIGSRRMEHKGEEPFTLIAVGVCGGGYKNEWQSNITAGTGELHEGFRSASELMIDRIAGYIATRGIKGRIKIWISGFSRAAAVANLTAGMLTRAGIVPKEDVYAYTYATPAAVMNPPEEGDENIYNILCPTDVVPQVMPAEWGYGRYGKDLYLPVPEFSSLGEILVEERQSYIKETVGIDAYYSPALNLRMRLLTSMVLELIRSRENYAENIQGPAVAMMQNIQASSLLKTMQAVLEGSKDIDSAARVSLDDLLNYLFRVFGNVITRTELAGANNNTGSAVFRLFTEHKEDTYLASLEIILLGIFEEDSQFTYVMVRGPVDVELNTPVWPADRMVLKENGTVLVADYETGELEEDRFQEYYMERMGDVSVVAVPWDQEIHVSWTANSAGTVEVMQANCGLRTSTRYPGMTSGAVKVKAGDSGIAWMPEERNGQTPEGFREQSWHAAEIARFLGISAPFVSWRVYVVLLFLVIALLIFAVIRLVSAFLPNKEKKGAVIWLLLAVFCIAAVEAEGAFWLLADRPVIRFAWKAVAGFSLLGMFFLRRNPEERILHSVLPGLAAAVAGDLVMTFTFLPGVILFFLGHVLLIVYFQHNNPMTRARWIQWAVLSLMTAAVVILAFVPRHGLYAWASAAYAPALFLMVYSVSDRNPRLRYAAGFFLISDLLLGASMTIWTDPIAHILCMALFYTSLMLLALGNKISERRKIQCPT